MSKNSPHVDPSFSRGAWIYLFSKVVELWKKNGVDSFCTDGAIAEQIIAKNTGRELPW